jgi:hypothetical protein
MLEQNLGVRTGITRSSANNEFDQSMRVGSLAQPGSNLVLGLNASQPPNQNCADDDELSNRSPSSAGEADEANHSLCRAVFRKLLGTFAHWSDLVVPRRKRHAFDHSNHSFDSITDRSVANLALQLWVGLLSWRRARAYSHYRTHSGADGPYLKTSLLLRLGRLAYPAGPPPLECACSCRFHLPLDRERESESPNRDTRLWASV